MKTARRRILFALLAASLALPTLAVEPLPIQDNSFLIEEAYNQEPGVIQHISTFMRNGDGSFVSTFTQEWPVMGQTHQLSYTLPLQRLGDPRQRGLGDTLVNYRYQLAGDGNARVAVAPRLSVILPTGSARRGLGQGGYGFDLNLPVSVAVTDRFVTHWNAGATKVPSSADPVTWSAGASAIVAALPKVHLMLETRWTHGTSSVLTVAPGLRWAHDVGKLQIVPGLAMPIGSDRSRAVYAYLSFEHPLR